MKILNYINFINQSIHENNSSLSFYKINEKALDAPWDEVDLVKFRLLTKDSETDLKKLFKEKFKQAIYELLTKMPNLYTNSQTDVDVKLNTNFFKSKTKTWTYKQIGGWIETRWNNLVFIPTIFIEPKDKEYLTGLETSIWDKEFQVLNGRSSSDAIMSYIYNRDAVNKQLDSNSFAYTVDTNNDKEDDLYVTILDSKSDYWKNRYTKIINDTKINNDEEYKKIFKLINSVTTDFTDLQWKIQGEFISLYVYFMTRLYANAIAKDIDKVDSKKLKEFVDDKDDQGDQSAQVDQGVQGTQGAQVAQGNQGNVGAQGEPLVAPVKKRKKIPHSAPTYDRAAIINNSRSFGW